MNGVAAGPNAGAYGPTKAAVGLLTEQMALEWAPTIRVNAVAPGLIDAGMSEQVYADPATRRPGRAVSRSAGSVEPTTWPSAVLWLASDRGRLRHRPDAAGRRRGHRRRSSRRCPGPARSTASGHEDP